MFFFVCTGFAVNLDLILDRVTDFNIRVGYLENDFLKQLVKVKDLEPKANCTKVTNPQSHATVYYAKSILSME